MIQLSEEQASVTDCLNARNEFSGCTKGGTNSDQLSDSQILEIGFCSVEYMNGNLKGNAMRRNHDRNVNSQEYKSHCAVRYKAGGLCHHFKANEKILVLFTSSPISHEAYYPLRFSRNLSLSKLWCFRDNYVSEKNMVLQTELLR
jgi:hypothetical protein